MLRRGQRIPSDGVNFERSVELLNRVQYEAGDAFLVDGPEDFVQGVLLSGEGVIPDRRSTRVIDDLENPSRLMLSAIDQDLDGRPIPGDLLAERGVDDLEFVVHSATPKRVMRAVHIIWRSAPRARQR